MVGRDLCESKVRDKISAVIFKAALVLFLTASGIASGRLQAQTSTNSAPILDPTLLEAPTSAPRALPMDSYPVPAPNIPVPAPMAAAPRETATPTPTPIETAPRALPIISESANPAPPERDPINTGVAALVILGSLGGFLLYQCGLTRAKNCAHTSMLVLIGASFGLTGYWMGGFAVQTGGVGDAHAALPQPVSLAQQGALDHELGLMTGTHHWGLMGNAGFFLSADGSAREGIATLFLAQAVLVAMSIGAALGGALERGRVLAMAVIAFLIGAVIYPLVANWIWGGGWLAEMGREFGLGHGVVDLAGAGVVHETAGAVGLAIALVLGPRHDRFQRHRTMGIPGHNVPFTVLGAFVLLIAVMASSVGAHGSATVDLGETGPALTNVILGALGGVLANAFLGAGRPQQPAPPRLSRGLIGGAVAICGGGALFDPWAAFLAGGLAGLLIQGVVVLLERREIDDPVNVTAVHGAAGAWGLLAAGLFANGTGGRGVNGITLPIRGLFFGGGWRQLAAQAIGCVADFVVVFGLSYLALQVVKRIVGIRVKAMEELQGLDWTQVGALGYQPDANAEDEPL